MNLGGLAATQISTGNNCKVAECDRREPAASPLLGWDPGGDSSPGCCPLISCSAPRLHPSTQF